MVDDEFGGCADATRTSSQQKDVPKAILCHVVLQNLSSNCYILADTDWNS